MKNVLIALGLTLAATSGAFADSSALDVQGTPELNRGNAAVTIAQGDYNGRNELTNTGPFNDRSPSFAPVSVGIDYTATASIGNGGHSVDLAKQPRLGDGVLPY